MATRRNTALEVIRSRLAAVEPFASGGGAIGVNDSFDATPGPATYPRALIWVLAGVKSAPTVGPFEETVELQVQLEEQKASDDTRTNYEVLLEVMAAAEQALLELRDDMPVAEAADIEVREWEVLEALPGRVVAVAYDVRIRMDHSQTDPEVDPFG